MSGKAIISDAEALLAQAAGLFAKLVDLLDQQLTIDGTKGFDRARVLDPLHVSVAILLHRLERLPTLLATLPDDLPLDRIPVSVLTTVQGSAADILQKLKDLDTILATILSNGGFNPTEWSTLQLSNPEGNHSVGLLKPLKTLLNQTDAILTAYNQILEVVTPGRLDFSSAVGVAVEAGRVAKDAADKAQKAIGDADAAAAEIASLRNSAQSLSGNITLDCRVFEA